jgi:selenocysteine lyase/cysteine desulfurase
VYSWRRISRDRGVSLRVVAPPDDAQGARGREWSTRLLDAIDRRTALVALSHVHWTDGTRFDLAAIGRRARECGAAFVIDGTQSVGALPFDVQAFAPDALVCAGYKWLMGPYAIGLAYYGPRFDDGVPLEEHWLARLGSEDFQSLVLYCDEYQPGVRRYDVGERSNFVLGPMLQAALDQVLEWDATEIQAYCRALTGPFVDTLRARGLAIEDDAWRGAHLFGLHLPPDLDVARLSARLDARRVSVSLRGAAVRIAPHVYNDAGDMAALVEALTA